MNKYILLTRVSPSAYISPENLSDSRKEVMQKLMEQFNDVTWNVSFAVGGPYDYLDIFEAETNEVAMKVSVMARSLSKSTTEIWPATSIRNFKDQVLNFEENIHKKQPAEDIVDEMAMDSFPASDPPSTTSTSASGTSN